MIRFFTASFDASVYLQQPDQNAGRDEVLEVGKLYYGDSKEVCRTLIKFPINNIFPAFEDSLTFGATGSWKAYLNLKCVQAEEIPLEYTIYANAVSQSWSMGTGTKFDNITSDGVSWKYRNGVNTWQDNTVAGTAVFNVGTTGSANAEGGTWYTASQSSQSFSYEEADIRMDVTDIVHKWVSGSASGGFDNNGFIIHHSLENENDTSDYGVLKFFSKETNTIYEPKLEIDWYDWRYDSNLSVPSGSVNDGYKLVVLNLQKEYTVNSFAKIRLKARDMYPIKSFSNTFEYAQTKKLPTGTFYQIEDYKTGDVICPFSDYTKVSADDTSNYFWLFLDNYPTNRTYKIKFRVHDVDEEQGKVWTTIIDERYLFEIID